MKTYHSLYNFTDTRPTVVTLGTFDGVHLGHQKILQRLTSAAAQLGLPTVVLTFFPHPRMVVRLDEGLKLLNTPSEKAKILEDNGIDYLVIHPFDESFANLSAREFVKNILIDIFHVRKIIIGYDHRFGKNRSADITDLQIFGQEYGFEVEQISVQEIDEVSVSSTKIRGALEKGDITLANQYLGYTYFITGTVQEGKKLGRTIGFPTANIQVSAPYKRIPKDGVYLVQVRVNNQLYNGMMNVGFNPTVQGKKQSLEVHIFDFEDDIYHKDIQIYFLKRLRNEQKFPSVEALKEQLQKDKKTALQYFNSPVK